MRFITSLGPILLFLVVVPLIGCSGGGDDNPVNEGNAGDGDPMVLEIPGGGQVVFQPGSLPAGATATVEESSEPPLPPGAEPAGNAVRVGVEGGVVMLPVEIRLPVPVGEDPEDLVIIQVEEDGTPIVLATVIEGDEVVAGSPGFGTSSMLADIRSKAYAANSSTARAMIATIQQVVGGPGPDDPELPSLDPPKKGVIAGPSFLGIGGAAAYSLAGIGLVSYLIGDAQWMFFGPIEAADIVDVPEFERSNQLFDERYTKGIRGVAAGTANIAVDYVDRRAGLRGFASRNVSVQEDLPAREEVLYLTGSPANASVNSGFSLIVVAAGFDVVEWAWDFGDGQVGAQGTSGPTPDNKLTKSYSFTVEGNYTITVSATGLSNVEVTAKMLVRVSNTSLEATITGPDRFPPTTGNDLLSFTARIMGGAPQFSADWEMFPTGQRIHQDFESSANDADFFFAEPGTYYMSIFIEDGTGETTTFTRLVTVIDSDPLDVDIARAAPRETTDGGDITVEVSIDGGILVVNGRKKPYEVAIHWGDGRTTTEMISSPQGPPSVTASFTHTYEDDGDYDVYAVVTDGVGDSGESESISIHIGAEEPGLPYKGCFVDVQIFANLSTTDAGGTTSFSEVRSFGSYGAAGAFSGNTFTGSYEQLNATGTIVVTLNDAHDEVLNVSWTELFEDDFFGITTTTTWTGSNISVVSGLPWRFETVGESACNGITTLNYTSGNGVTSTTLTGHTCDDQSWVVVGFTD